MNYSIIGAGNCFKLWKAAFDEYGISLQSVCDIDEEKLKDLNCRVYSNINELLQYDKSDYIILTSPVSTHFDIASKIISSGRNLIIEKPISYRLDHVEALCAMAKEKNVRFICSYHAAFSPDVNRFVSDKAIFEKGMGRLVGFECDFYDPYVINGATVPKAESLYGSYLDSAINALSVISRLIGIDGMRAVTDVSQFISKDNRHSAVSYEKDDIRGVIRTDWRTGQNLKTTRLIYENGHILLNHSMQRIEEYKTSLLGITDCNENGKERLLNQYVSTLKAIETGTYDIASHTSIYKLLLGNGKE